MLHAVLALRIGTIESYALYSTLCEGKWHYNEFMTLRLCDVD